MDRTVEIYNIVKAIKNGEISDDVAQIRILRLFSFIAQAEALSDLMDFAADVCPDNRCGELADIIERL